MTIHASMFDMAALPRTLESYPLLVEELRSLVDA